MTREVQVLPEAPGMGVAFARALVPGRGGPAAIPDHAVRLEAQQQDVARLADYSRVCGLTLRDSVPPTWIHVLSFPLHVQLLGDPASSIRLVGAVHVSNSMTLRRPVSLGERLGIQVHVENLRPHARGGLIDLVGRADVDGETVWEGVSTYLASGARVDGDPVEIPRAPFEPAAPMGRWRLPAGLGREYRRVSGDPNLIHTSRIASKAFGFARPIIHGMWTHARALGALEGRLPEAYTVEAAWAKPILLPATVGFTVAPTDAGHRAAVTSKDGAKLHMSVNVRANQ